MPRYCLALLPQDPKLGGDITLFAQKRFAQQADSFILGDETLPHLPLCGFEGKFEQLGEIWFATNHTLSEIVQVGFKGLQLRLERDEDDEDYVWAELAADRLPEIIHAQRQMTAALAERRLTTYSLPGEAYYPAVQLARLKGDASLPALGALREDFWNVPHSFEYSIGLCDEWGGYKERVF